jgi:predicted RNase H-like nuclease (RuvC/YqgF family)
MDEQLEVLRAIWGEMKGLNGRVTTTNERLDELRGELKAEMGELRGEVGGLKAEMGGLKAEMGGLKAEMGGLRSDIDLVHRRSVDRDLRLGTSLTELSRDVRELTLVVHDWRDEHRLDREDLRGRVERLERHVGLGPR